MNCKPTKDENTFSAIQEKESKLNNEIIQGLNEQHGGINNNTKIRNSISQLIERTQTRQQQTIRVTISLPSSEKKPEDNSK